VGGRDSYERAAAVTSIAQERGLVGAEEGGSFGPESATDAYRGADACAGNGQRAIVVLEDAT